MGFDLFPWTLTVRSVVNTLLTALILACPFLCGAVEAGHDAHQDHGTGNPGHNQAPSHCPEAGDDCVCRGAVQSSDVKVPHAESVSFPLSLHGLTGALAHSLAHPLTHLTTDGTPTGLASWGDSLAVRALLQNFRC